MIDKDIFWAKHKIKVIIGIVILVVALGLGIFFGFIYEPPAPPPKPADTEQVLSIQQDYDKNLQTYKEWLLGEHDNQDLSENSPNKELIEQINAAIDSVESQYTSSETGSLFENANLTQISSEIDEALYDINRSDAYKSLIVEHQSVLDQEKNELTITYIFANQETYKHIISPNVTTDMELNLEETSAEGETAAETDASVEEDSNEDKTENTNNTKDTTESSSSTKKGN